MPWSIEYKGRKISGENGCDECTVEWITTKFEWETVHKSVRSAQIAITRYEKQEQPTKEKQQ